ncbi:hypothetical protein IQ266_25100 [filamentous cyanobacterium LEGE 11480]|uniref:Uncharacterized protein n=1 Tax=Romeriopsis navalis LEGE 11480 TaxID=2777977 RepID=A0A928Z6U8_9CYAN|nr:hypothetical protein [Romeriopsis navalis]MBE9033018.1 hypothetical protein [Romeriopsis navalis LEGE 11480]
MKNRINLTGYLPLGVCMLIAGGLIVPRLPTILGHAQGLRGMVDPLAAQESRAKAADQLAQQHYKSGCQMLITHNAQGKPVFASIPIGQPAINAATRLPFADMTVFCDHTGTTVLVKDGIFHPDTVAFARDRTVIHAAMQRYQGVQYEAPVAVTQEK